MCVWWWAVLNTRCTYCSGGGIPLAAAPAKAAPPSAKAAAPAKAVVPSGLAVEFSSVGPFFGRPEITEAEMLALESGGGTEIDGW